MQQLDLKYAFSERPSEHLCCIQEKQYPPLKQLSYDKFIVGIRKNLIRRNRFQFIFNDGAVSDLDTDVQLAKQDRWKDLLPADAQSH